MKKDVENRKDIELVLRKFYEQAFVDDTIGFFFTEVVPLDLETHLPVIADFWESVLFGSRSYGKNVMEIHQHISSLSKIEKHHLGRWVLLFHQAVNDNFEGNNSELMKQRARSIATLMEIKLNGLSIQKL